MSEDCISINIYPSHLEEFADFLEKEIERLDDFEEIERYFYMLENLRDEYYRGRSKLQRDYKKAEEESHSIYMLRRYIKEVEEPPLFIQKDENHIDKFYDFKKKLSKLTFCDYFLLYLLCEGRATKEQVQNYIDNFKAWMQQKDGQDTKIDYW